MAVSMSILVLITSKIKKYPRSGMASIKEVWHSFQDSFFALITPVIIIGGIVLGIFTPTEAAIVAVIYATALSLVYREIRISDLPRIITGAINTTLGILLIIAAANLFGYLLTISQMPQVFSRTLLSWTDNQYILLLMINLIFLIAGCFLEPTAAMVILVPVMMPIIKVLGISPVHFGIIVILNLMIGLMTPPIGLVLYVLSGISDVPFEKIARAILPYLFVLIIVLLFVTFIPAISMTLPGILFG